MVHLHLSTNHVYLLCLNVQIRPAPAITQPIELTPTMNINADKVAQSFYVVYCIQKFIFPHNINVTYEFIS